MIFKRLSIRAIALCTAVLSAATMAPADAGASPQPLVTLFSFAGGRGGTGPLAGLTALGGKLYGTTEAGGAKGAGTVFAFDPATNGFSVLHAFRDTPDGNQPYAGLTAVGTTLYGTTFQGGKIGSGSVYSIDTASGAYRILYAFGTPAPGTLVPPTHPTGNLTVLDGVLHGTASSGGSNDISCISQFYYGCGAVFRIDPITRRTSIDYEFKSSADGANPTAGLATLDGALYGTTQYGGANGGGSVFRIDPPSGKTTLYSFPGNGGESFSPNSELVPVGRMLYGTTLYGGTARACGSLPAVCGTVYRVDAKTGALTTVHLFSVRDGVTPVGLASVKGMLYGWTYGGGKLGWGSIFSIDPATGTFTSLYSFTGGTGGTHPAGAPVVLGGSVYGVTTGGGAAGQGTIFRFTP